MLYTSTTKSTIKIMKSVIIIHIIYYTISNLRLCRDCANQIKHIVIEKLPSIYTITYCSCVDLHNTLEVSTIIYWEVSIINHAEVSIINVLCKL